MFRSAQNSTQAQRILRDCLQALEDFSIRNPQSATWSPVATAHDRRGANGRALSFRRQSARDGRATTPPGSFVLGSPTRIRRQLMLDKQRHRAGRVELTSRQRTDDARRIFHREILQNEVASVIQIDDGPTKVVSVSFKIFVQLRKFNARSLATLPVQCDERRIHANFFVIGSVLDKYDDAVAVRGRNRFNRRLNRFEITSPIAGDHDIGLQQIGGKNGARGKKTSPIKSLGDSFARQESNCAEGEFLSHAARHRSQLVQTSLIGH